MKSKSYNPFETAQASSTAWRDAELDPPPASCCAGRCGSTPSPSRPDGRRKMRIFRDSASSTTTPRPSKGGIRFHPRRRSTPSAPLHVDDLEVRGRDIPWAALRGRDLRPAPPDPARAGGPLPRLGAPGVAQPGPEMDVPAPDVMTTPSTCSGCWTSSSGSAAAATGLHHRQAGRDGRLAGPDEATGYGVVFTIREALKELGSAWRTRARACRVRQRLPVRGAALPAARRQGGLRLLLGPGGPDLLHLQEAEGSASRSCSGSRTASAGSTSARRASWATRCCRGRRGSSRTWTSHPRASRTGHGRQRPQDQPQVRVIAEGRTADTPEADGVIKERGSSSSRLPGERGGVTCSYFEQVQSNMNYYWRRRGPGQAGPQDDRPSSR